MYFQKIPIIHFNPSRGHTSACSCHHLPHNWGRSWLLHFPGEHARASSSGVPGGMALPSLLYCYFIIYLFELTRRKLKLLVHIMDINAELTSISFFSLVNWLDVFCITVSTIQEALRNASEGLILLPRHAHCLSPLVPLGIITPRTQGHKSKKCIQSTNK